MWPDRFSRFEVYLKTINQITQINKDVNSDLFPRLILRRRPIG